ncbi:PAS domain S-box protein [Dehalogenimonas etheniformans]|uniref:histidine kinase n=1 Tax=Dehalogenimonas etheniformans TaxID=1536648 RepID=A0A2P5P7P1_9CHLR|nr:PAS domain S-box protein [Dehalogenimonas etheniformans]PPD58299.1 PAS domain S-box protein [Dehalogenimonas etheniformans]QNT75709.1 PAS domain S-box protein [Dehalogenimonas etheniformans]
MSSGFDLLKLFDVAPGRFLVLAADPPKFTILAVTDKYLSATQTKRDDIVGKGFLEVFPGNIADPASKAGDKVRSSFERVIGLRAPDSIGITEHEIPDAKGQFETRWWDTTNSPIFGAEGEVTAIMHRIEDVTRWELQRRKLAEQDSAVVALRDARRAAINLMEDAIDARRQADEINDKLKKEIQEHREAESEILALSRFPMENPNPVLRVTAEGVLEYANSASSYILSCWGVSRGDPLSGEIRAIIAETLAAGKHKQIELEFGGHFYDFVLAPVSEEGYVNLYARDITERKQAEIRIRRLTEIHSVLSKVNETIVRTSDKQDLFDEVCRIITEDGHYPLAWIGEVADEKVIPKSSSGSATNYLHDIRIEVHGALSKGPTGTAIRDNQSVVNVNFESNPTMSLWRSKAQEYGLGSSAAFPLRVNSNAIAVLTVYGSESDAFDPEATALFESLSADVSYALETIIAKESKGRAEAALRESEDSYRSVVENTTSIILRLDLTGNITFANARALEFFGYSKEELLGKPAVGTIVPAMETTGRDLARMVGQIATNPDAFHINANENICKDGRRVWLEWTNSGIYGLDCKLKGFLSVGIDATERNNAEEALRSSEERYRSLIETAQEGIATHAPDGTITYVNNRMAELLGYDKEELIGKRVTDFMFDDDKKAAENARDNTKQPNNFVSELRLRKKDGAELWTLTSIASLKADTGNLTGFLGMHTDITKRKKAEIALKESEERFRAVQDNSLDRFTILKPFKDEHGEIVDFVYVYQNAQSAKLTGRKPEELIGRCMTEIFPTFPQTNFFKIYERVAETGKPEQFEDRYNADGVDQWFHATVTAIPDGIAVATQIITDRKKTEAQVSELMKSIQREKDRLASVVNSIPDEVWFADMNKNFTLANPSAVREFGPISGKNQIDVESLAKSLEVYRPDGSPRPVDEAPPLRALKGETVRGQEEIIRTPASGDLRYRQVNAAPVKDVHGNIIGSVAIVRDITESKKAEEALQQSETRYRNLVEQMIDGIFVADTHGHYVDVNAAGAAMFGYTPEELCSLTLIDLLAPEELPRLPYQISSLANGAILRNEWKFRRKDGTTFIGELVGRQLPDGRLQGILRDTTERKLIENALRESEEKYRGIVETSNEGIWMVDHQRRTTYVNHKMADMLGYTIAEMMAKKWQELVPEKERSKSDARIERRKHGADESYEYQLLHKNGSILWVTINASPIFDSGGKFAGTMSMITDITDRKQSEDSLLKSRERAQILADANAMLLKTDDPVTIIQPVAERVMKHLDCDVFFNFIVDAESGRLRLNAYSGIPEGVAKDITWLEIGSAICGCVARDGCRIISEDIQHNTDIRADLVRSFGVQVYACHPLQQGDETVGTLSFGTRTRPKFTDTELEMMRMVADQVSVAIQRKRAEEALLKSEERFFKSFYASPAGMTIARLPEGQWTQVNEAFLRITGYSRDELIGHTSLELNMFTNPVERISVIKALDESGKALNEHTVRRKDGRLITVLAAVEKVTIGDSAYNIASIMDITERKNAERMKDEFVGMISHELKTPITVVIGALSTAAMPGIPEKVKTDLFLDAVNHADILASIVDNLLELSRHQSRRLELRKKLLDAGDIACKVAESMKRKSDLHVLKCDFPKSLPKIQADPLRLERIFYNLVENAIKYSPAGGEVRVFADIQGNFLRIGISDQGIGISEENLNRLFQPFERLGFEVKGAIQGTGLGLRVCRILTEAHGGKIWVDSKLGKGSTFYFTLPLQTP